MSLAYREIQSRGLVGSGTPLIPEARVRISSEPECFQAYFLKFLQFQLTCKEQVLACTFYAGKNKIYFHLIVIG